MKFILWTLTYWGMIGLSDLAYYGYPMRYAKEAVIDECGGAYLIDFIAQWFLYFFLYNKFVEDTRG